MKLESISFKAILCLSVIVCIGAAASAANAFHLINRSFFGGLALKGYDSVSYFKVGRAEEGKKEYSIQWQGATWRFVNAEHREMFITDPDQYTPQYGGYCAYSMSKGERADIDPNQWEIVDGKLYLLYNEKLLHYWEKNRDTLIRQANAAWSRMMVEN